MCEISFEAGHVKGSWPMIEPTTLKPLKLAMNDIKAITSYYFEISDYPYTKAPYAGLSHPLEGSIGIFFVGKDDLERSIHYLLFHDYNPTNSHKPRRQHGNTETLVIEGGQVSRFRHNVPDSMAQRFHIIPYSPSIQFILKDSKGNIIAEKTVNTVPMSQVRMEK